MGDKEGGRFYMGKYIQQTDMDAYRFYLVSMEKSLATIEKYLRDINGFCSFAGGRTITKELVIAYKEKLIARYAVASVNSMLAAINGFLSFAGYGCCRVRQVRTQRRAYCHANTQLTKSEYLRLVDAAAKTGDERLNLILQSICATGMRVSELAFLTVDALWAGRAEVCLKGKTRTVLIPGKLQKRLKQYIKRHKIESGPIFVTANGKAVNRSNIWKAMKRLCAAANVEPGKVYPHNLRRLFARTFYHIKKDIAKLADVLGHSRIETTRIYIMETGEEHVRIVSKLGLVA